MSVRRQAASGHLIVGSVQPLLGLASLIASLTIGGAIFSILVFFFGVWGGLESSRFLELVLSQSSASEEDEI
jgi:hypothetical protein